MKKNKIKHILQLRHNISVTNICNKTVIRNLHFFLEELELQMEKLAMLLIKLILRNMELLDESPVYKVG